MKILTINCSPDLSYFTNKGLKIDTVNMTVPNLKFPLRYLYKVKDTDGNMVDMSTPDVGSYLEAMLKSFQYSMVFVGWNPADYGPEVKHTGGFTNPAPLTCGTFWATVRQDNPVVPMYAPHEASHMLIRILWKMNLFPKDYMDSTPVNGVMIPFYENGPKITDPNSNFNQTFKQIQPYVNNLNSITYPQVVTLTRKSDDTIQTLGDLNCGTFTCHTLERPWKNNASNISCIPKGQYTVKWTFSVRMLRFTYEVQNVPARSGIRIHPANFWSDLLGCIALGDSYGDLNHDKQADLLNSKVTVDKFNTLMGKKDFVLNVV